MAINLVVAPVGLLLLIGAILLVWWLVKQAPGWVVALLGGGLVLMGGFAALFMMMSVRTESRVQGVTSAQRPGDGDAPSRPNVSASTSAGAERISSNRDGGSAIEADTADGRSNTIASSEDWPYRGRHPADDGPHRAATWNLAIGGLLLIVVVGVGLLVGFVALCIYLFKKHPALIVLPIFGGLGLVVVILGFAWVAVDSPSIVYSEPSKLSASAETDNGVTTEAQLETRYEVIAPASGGTVTEILVRHNATVEAGEVLLKLENPTLQQARQKKLADIAATDKQLEDGDESKKVELEISRSAQLIELDSIDRRISHLEIKSPAAGRIVNQDLHNAKGQTIEGGVVILYVFESNEPVAVDGDAATNADIAVEEADSAPKPPEWTESLKLTRIDGVDRQTVVIGPHLNLDRHDDELYQEIHAVMRTYVEGLPGVDSAQHFRVPVDYINDNIIRAEYIETHDYSVGRMKRKFVLLQFDHRVKKEIEEMYRDKLLENRLSFAAVGSCLLLMLIGTVYGYLKLDTQTKGYYSGRLKLATAAAILLVVVLAVFLSRGGIIM